MLDKKLFENVTKNENGKRIGLKHRENPEFIETMKESVREFNGFVNEIINKYNNSNEIYKLKIKGVNNNWQNSGYYNPYFWNKILLDNNDYDGIILWLLFNVEGLRITIGTTKTLEDKNITLANRINEDMKNMFTINIDNFDIKMDSKYISYLYKKNNVDVNDFVKALDVIVPKYEKVFQKYIDAIFDKKLVQNSGISDDMVQNLINKGSSKL